MLKILGIIAIFSMCTAIGLYKSRQLKIRCEMLNLIKEMLNKISVMIKYQSLTVLEILDCLGNDKSLLKLGFLDAARNENGTFPDRWSNSLDNWENPLACEEINLLRNIGNTLGTSDIDGQLSSLLVFDSELCGLISKAEQDCVSKGKLYRSLGVLSGAFISIILI